MITLKTFKDGNGFFTHHIVTVNGEKHVFATLREAWAFVFSTRCARAQQKTI